MQHDDDGLNDPMFEAGGSGCSGSAEHGERLLDDAREFIRKFCVFPNEHCLNAVTLWAAHTHIVEHLHTTPRLALLSPEAGSGKTRVLDVLELLVPAPEYSLSASPASIFRLLAENQITLLFDEIDTIWSHKGKDDNNEDLRALLNAGYKRGAQIPRCVGPKHEVMRFPVYCAVALAGLGDMPDTIMSRSVIVRMRKRAPYEVVSEFRSRKHAPAGYALRDRLALWTEATGAKIGDDWPTLPEGIVDRPAEVWEPLVALADAAGGHWPDTARSAAVFLCRAAQDRRASLGVRLLADLRTIFRGADALYTSTIIERLTRGEDLDADAPWSDLRGKPIADRGIATLLKRYDVHSTKVRENGGRPLQGYSRANLWDAWQRYLPPVGTGSPEHPEQAAQPNGGAAFRVPDCPQACGTSGTSERNGADDAFHMFRNSDSDPERQNPRHTRVSPDVPDVPDMREERSATEHDDQETRI